MAAALPRHPAGVVRRICDELRVQIQSGILPVGSQMASVRHLAKQRQISTFTAAEIYNALVATGLLDARPGRGYFVTKSGSANTRITRTQQIPVDSLWEHRREASGRVKVDAGCGWLPADWLDNEGIRRALRAVARHSPITAGGYGSPYGFDELRIHLAAQTRLRGLEIGEDQILLTHGASHALDLIIKHLLSPGDTVIVEDPGYPPIFELLRSRGVKLLAIPRCGDGPDVDALAQLLKRRRAHFMFTNTTCHNPTGTTTSAAVAHRLLELAGKFDFRIVEDDIFAELAPRPESTLASLDGLQRVYSVSSLSKTISPDLRIGYIRLPRGTAETLARAKIMTSLSTSELMERIALQVLTDGQHRRHLERLRHRLAEAQVATVKAFEALGVELAYKPQAGLFLWGKLPSKEPVGKLWQLALRANVLLAPGELFRPHGAATPYWRFNVAYCDSPDLYAFIDSLRR